MRQSHGPVARSLAAGQALRGRKRHPTVEDRAAVYAGATIIGERSTIGAGVSLMTSVPANSLVLMEETNAKIIPKTSRESNAPDYQILGRSVNQEESASAPIIPS